MTAVIETAGLVKTFGRTRALDGLDLHIGQGEVHGFLGPNGSGKSTTIRVLLGVLRADSGTVRLLGGDPWYDAATLHRRLAYVPGEVQLWPQLSGGEVIDLLGRLRGGLDEARRAELLELFDLDPRTKCRAYSKGNRTKVALIAALASNVELLLLDEPSSGLDPLMGQVFEQCIDRERERGRTVLLSSHILSEVERLCDRVSIIKEGRTVEAGSLTQLRHLTRTHLAAELKDGAAAPGCTSSALLDGLTGVHNVAVTGTRLTCQVDTAHLGPVLERLARVGIASLTSAPPTLEELFLRHYARGSDTHDRQPA